MARTFDELVTEADSVSVAGWASPGWMAGAPSSAGPGVTNDYCVNDWRRQPGLDVVDLRHEQIRLEFFDVGAVIYLLRKLNWVVPNFTVAKYRDKLLELRRYIEAEGAFVTVSSRVLIEARKWEHR